MERCPDMGSSSRPQIVPLRNECHMPTCVLASSRAQIMSSAAMPILDCALADLKPSFCVVLSSPPSANLDRSMSQITKGPSMHCRRARLLQIIQFHRACKAAIISSFATSPGCSKLQGAAVPRLELAGNNCQSSLLFTLIPERNQVVDLEAVCRQRRDNCRTEVVGAGSVLRPTTTRFAGRKYSVGRSCWSDFAQLRR